MNISNSISNRHSENDFSLKFSTYVDAGVGIIHVRTKEVLRAAVAVRKQALIDGGVIKEWDVVNGFRSPTADTVSNVIFAGDGNIDIGSAFSAPLDQLRNQREEGVHYFVYINPHVFMENNPTITQLLILYSHCLPSTNVVVVIITPDIPLPAEADAAILSLPFDPPGLGELRESLTSILKGVEANFDGGIDVSTVDKDKVCYVGAGMAKNHFEMYAALSIVEAARHGEGAPTADDIIAGVSVGKTDVVNSNDILELYPSTDIKNVGGLENLKNWVTKRKGCYSDEAKEFGIEPPKGIVLVGVPGSGKSLIAKAISSELGVPLVRLDFGRVFNSLVGASEQRMRTALKMVETMSPCVLFCVDGKTAVTLADGTTERIEDMYANTQKGCTYDLQGVCPETGTLITLPMRTIIRTQGKPMVKITSITGRTIEVTTDHRLLVNRGGERAWVPASELSVGDDLVEV